MCLPPWKDVELITGLMCRHYSAGYQGFSSTDFVISELLVRKMLHHRALEVGRCNCCFPVCSKVGNENIVRLPPYCQKNSTFF